MNLGAQMSIAGGVHLALQRGREIGCNAVQLFVKNPSEWRAKKLTEEEISLFKEEKKSFNPEFILAHTSYLVNLASPDPELLAKSRRGFLEEMRRSDTLGIPYIIIHPGSHKGSGEERGFRTIADSLNFVLSMTRGYELCILLETTAGQGNSLGYTFEQLATIIEMTDEGERLGICFDTCHSFAAGYDLRTRQAYNETFLSFDQILGLSRLKAFHMNDALGKLGSHRDRHTHIGQGELGLRAFSLLVNDPRFHDRPMVLETPKGPDMEDDIRNLSILRGLRKRSDHYM